MINLFVMYRSLCSVVCKWTYEANEIGNIGWNSEFFSTLGIEDLLENKAYKIGTLSPAVASTFESLNCKVYINYKAEN